MRDPYTIIKAPRVTEKSTSIGAQNKYVFEVDRHATKQEIKFAVQRLFKKTVTDVNTMNVGGKVKRARTGRPTTTPSKKKAVVTLKQGETLEFV